MPYSVRYYSKVAYARDEESPPQEPLIHKRAPCSRPMVLFCQKTVAMISCRKDESRISALHELFELPARYTIKQKSISLSKYFIFYL